MYTYAYSLYEIKLPRVIMLSPRSIDYLTKTPVPDMRNPPFKLLIREVQGTPQTTYAIAVALGCLPNVGCKATC